MDGEQTARQLQEQWRPYASDYALRHMPDPTVNAAILRKILGPSHKDAEAETTGTPAPGTAQSAIWVIGRFELEWPPWSVAGMGYLATLLLIHGVWRAVAWIGALGGAAD